MCSLDQLRQRFEEKKGEATQREKKNMTGLQTDKQTFKMLDSTG